MNSNNAETLLARAHAETLQTGLPAATDYTSRTASAGDWMPALGQTAAKSCRNAVLDNMSKQFGANAVAFGGVLGMVGLNGRVKPLSQLDVGRVRRAREVLGQERSAHKLLGSIEVRAGVSSGVALGNLQRVERDADFDMLCLSIWWHKPSDDAAHHLKDMCRDLAICAQKVGQELELEVERFKRV